MYILAFGQQLNVIRNMNLNARTVHINLLYTELRQQNN